MKPRTLPLKEFEERLRAIRIRLEAAKLEALLIFGGGNTSTGNVRYVSNWYSNSIYNQSLLLLPVDEDPILFIRLQPQRAKQLSWIQDIRQSGRSGHTAFVDDCIEALNLMHLGESNIGLVGNPDETWRGMAQEELKKTIPRASFSDADAIMASLRIIKSPAEMNAMRHARFLVERSLSEFRVCLAERRTDFQILGASEFVARSEGAEEMLNFLGISKRGQFIPPISLAPPSGRILAHGDVIIVEFNECAGGYRSESLRMACLGTPTRQEKSIFDAAYRCYETVLKEVKPGRTIGEVVSEGARVLDDLGYPADKYVSKTHSSNVILGHGIGLDMLEPPLLATDNQTVFEKGMTFVLHPGIFGAYSGKKWGALIGETVHITESGAEPIFEGKWRVSDFAMLT